jgi:hypothetical protein
VQQIQKGVDLGKSNDECMVKGGGKEICGKLVVNVKHKRKRK